MNIHELLYLRYMLKDFMKQMNKIQYEHRDDEIKEIRNLITRKYDKLGQEAYKGLKKIDPSIKEEN